MTGTGAAPTLPPGGVLPPANRWQHGLRMLLVLGGLAFALWLLGMLLGSQHASAAEAGSTTTPRTPASLAEPLHAVTRAATTSVQTVQIPLTTRWQDAQKPLITDTHRPARPAVTAAEHTLSAVQAGVANDLGGGTGPVAATVRQVTGQVLRVIPAVAGADPAPYHPAAATRLTVHPAPRPVVHRAVADALQAGVRPTHSPASHVVVSAAVDPPGTTLPSAPAPPADPTMPAPAAPSIPGTGDGHKLPAAALPDRVMLPQLLSGSAATDDVLADDFYVYDPSFSPD